MTVLRAAGSGRWPAVATLGLLLAASATISITDEPPTNVGPLAPVMLVTAALGLGFLTMTRRDPATLLSAYVTVLLLVPAHYVVAGMGPLGSPATALGLLALLWWALGRLHPDSRIARSVTPLHIALAVFVVAVLLGMGIGWARPLSDAEGGNLVRRAIEHASYLGVALLAVDGLQGPRDVRRVLSWVTVFGGIIGLIGVAEFLTQNHFAATLDVPGFVRIDQTVSGINERSALFRVFSTTTNPIEFGVVLSALFPIALYRWLDTEDGSILPVLGIGMALPLTISRSAVVGLTLGLVVAGSTWSMRRRLNAAVLLVGSLAVLRSAVPGLVGTLFGLFKNAGVDPSISGRTDDFGPAMAYVFSRPLLGRGFATFVPDEYRLLDNQYLLTAIELGLFGLMGLVALLLIGIVDGRYVRRHALDPDVRSAALALIACTAVIALSAAFFDLLSFRMISGVLFLALGSVGALRVHVATPRAQS